MILKKKYSLLKEIKYSFKTVLEKVNDRKNCWSEQCKLKYIKYKRKKKKIKLNTIYI